MQARIIETLVEIRDRLGLAVVFISHDLALVGRIAERVYVLYRGEIVEEGPSAQVLVAPRHPYTQALVALRPGAPSQPTNQEPVHE